MACRGDHAKFYPHSFTKTHKNHEAISLLLKAGASPNARDQFGESTLHVAIGSTIEIVETLLLAGANVNAKNAGGITPLMLAAGSGNLKLVELLINHEANISLLDEEGNSAIEWATRNKHDNIARLLHSAR